MTAARGDKVRFLSSHAHAVHPTRPVDKGISALRPDCELAVASIDLPTRSSAFEWEIKFYGLSASPAIERQKCTGSQAHAGAFLRICATQSKRRMAVNCENLHAARRPT